RPQPPVPDREDRRAGRVRADRRNHGAGRDGTDRGLGAGGERGEVGIGSTGFAGLRGGGLRRSHRRVRGGGIRTARAHPPAPSRASPPQSADPAAVERLVSCVRLLGAGYVLGAAPCRPARGVTRRASPWSDPPPPPASPGASSRRVRPAPAIRPSP